MCKLVYVHGAPVEFLGVCVIPGVRLGVRLSHSCWTERAAEHGDAVGRLCGGRGLLLRCPNWR